MWYQDNKENVLVFGGLGECNLDDIDSSVDFEDPAFMDNEQEITES